MPLLTVDEFGGTDASEVLYLNGSQQWLNENYVGNLNTTTAYSAALQYRRTGILWRLAVQRGYRRNRGV